MSASSTPTVRPVAAMAAARLTVTEDLPTPPLPEAISTTLVVGASAVSSGRWETLKRALPMAEDFSSCVISVQSRVTLAHAGQRSDPGPDVPLDLGPQRASRRGERDGDDDGPVRIDGGPLGHAQLDDVAAQLGVDDPAQHGDHILLGRERRCSHGRILPGRAV